MNPCIVVGSATSIAFVLGLIADIPVWVYKIKHSVTFDNYNKEMKKLKEEID